MQWRGTSVSSQQGEGVAAGTQLATRGGGQGGVTFLGAGMAAAGHTGGAPVSGQRRKKGKQWVDLVVKDEKARGFSVKLKFSFVSGLN